MNISSISACIVAQCTSRPDQPKATPPSNNLNKTAEDLEIYQSDKLKVSFSYTNAKDWKIGQENELPEKQTRVLFITGPKETITGTGRAVIMIRVSPTAEKGGKFKTLDEYIDNSIDSRSHRGQTGKRIDRNSVVAGKPAVEVGIEYPILLPTYSIGSEEVMTKKTWVVFEHHGDFYEIVLTSATRDYATNSPVFETIQASFKILED